MTDTPKLTIQRDAFPTPTAFPDRVAAVGADYGYATPRPITEAIEALQARDAALTRCESAARRVTVEGDRIVIDGPWSPGSHDLACWPNVFTPRDMTDDEVRSILRDALRAPLPEPPRGECPIRIQRDKDSTSTLPHLVYYPGGWVWVSDAEAAVWQALVDAWNTPAPQRDDGLTERCLIAAETRDLDHLDELEAANMDPQRRRLREIIQRRRDELAVLLAPTPQPIPVKGSQELAEAIERLRQSQSNGYLSLAPRADAVLAAFDALPDTPQPTDLPEGVRWAMVLDPGFPVPDGMERRYMASGEGWVTKPNPDGNPAAEVRFVRPPSQPATEKVDWHASQGERLADGRTIAAVMMDGCAWFRQTNAPGDTDWQLLPIDANGMVTVLREGES